jgi:exodeoxyribonuclease V beta subunit
LTKKWANQTLPELVAEDIGQLLTSHTSIEYRHDGSKYQRPIRPSDIAVLTRTNRQLVDVQEALRDRHIPSVRTGAGSVFTTPAARELAELLHAVAEPGHGGKLRTALSTSFFGLSGNQIYETRENDRLWETWTGHFNHWHTLWNENGFIRMFHTVMAFEQGEDGLPCHGRILDRPGGERRITNLMHLRELLHEEALRKNLGIAGLLSWFELKRAEGSDSAEAAQLRLESDANAVQLVTIFKSKGLEYPIVYCPFLYETAVRDNKSRPVVFHDPLNQEPKLDIGSETFEQHKRIAAREKMAEDLRLTYVALTRAKCLCVTVWGMLHKDQQRTPSSLAYLLHNQGGQCDVQEMGKQMDTLTDDHLLDDLNLIAKGSDGAIQITVAKPETEKTSLRVDKEPELLACRRQTRAIETDRQVSSFSALTSK